MYGFIYKTTCITNGKIYIGQCKYYRVLPHQTYLGSGTLLKRAILKYGKESFSREVLRECTVDDIDRWERYFIFLYNSTNTSVGYNLELGGGVNKLVAPEFREKMRAAKLGKRQANEHKLKCSEKKLGELNPNYGKVFSEETREKMREAHRLRWAARKGGLPPVVPKEKDTTNPNYGRVFSEDVRARMSQAQKIRREKESIERKRE